MDVLTPVLTAVRFESALMMEPPGGETLDAERDYAAALGPDVPISRIERFAFYEAVRSPEVGLVIATADERIFANILLTIGLR
jgi:L-fucose mutarotase